MKSWDLFIYIIMAGIVLTIEGGHLHSSFHIHCTLSELSNPANGENQCQPYFYRLNPNTSKRS